MRKIDIYNEILATYQKIDKEFGEYYSSTRKNIERSVSYVSSHTKWDLEIMLLNVEKLYNNKLKEKKQAEYLVTEEGHTKLVKLESEIKDLYEQSEQAIKNDNDYFNKVIKEYLGERWGVRYFDAALEVHLLDDKGKPLFGHDFKFYVNKRLCGDNRFELNYGCLGAFDVFEDKNRLEYLRGMAKLANDSDMCQSIYSAIMECSNELDVLCDKRRDLENHKKYLGLS